MKAIKLTQEQSNTLRCALISRINENKKLIKALECGKENDVIIEYYTKQLNEAYNLLHIV